MESFDPALIPSFPPLAFPIPLWLSKILLVLGFFLHAVPMNIILGGTLLAAFFLWNNSKYSAKAGRDLVLSLPVILSFAITQGIVPLLFLQLVYGPLYYSSSIFMAVPWISIIAILIIAYYLLYIVKFNEDKLTGWGKNVLLTAGLIFLVIAFFFTNNMTMMLNPANWNGLEEITIKGNHLNLIDPQLIPRYLHFVIAGFAVTGLYIGCFGLFVKKDGQYSEWLIKTGSSIYVISTLIQFGIGTWFLLSLGQPTMKAYMGQDLLGTISFGISLILTIVSLIAGIIATNKANKTAMIVSTVTGLITVLGMIIMRHVLREVSVSEFFKPETIPIDIQWDIFAAFGVLAIGLIVYLVWLSKLTWGALKK